jgi:sugar lactone lactonase YvrE
MLSSALSTSQERYAIMGAWKDAAGNIYAAVYGDSQVKKIDPAGRITTVATSASSWAPTGGCSAPDGSLWVLETSKTNAQRVRHITSDGKEQIF